MSTCKFRAGDTVFHKPLGETWILAVDEFDGKVSPCGWPETIAESTDCELKQRACDAKRHSQLLESSKIKASHDIRRTMAEFQLNKAREE